MTPDIRGYHLELRDGWKLTVNAWGGYTVAWLTNRGLDTGFYETELPGETMLELEALGYVPSAYSEGVETPPLVLFHSARLEPRMSGSLRAGVSIRQGACSHARASDESRQAHVLRDAI